MTLISVEHLQIIDSWTNVKLIKDVHFSVAHGETLGMIGESGSGKSISCKALTGLNPGRLHVTGNIYFENQNLIHLSKRDLRHKRGKDIAMVMQQGTRAFDPSTPVGKQMFETMRIHLSLIHI